MTECSYCREGVDSYAAIRLDSKAFCGDNCMERFKEATTVDYCVVEPCGAFRPDYATCEGVGRNNLGGCVECARSWY